MTQEYSRMDRIEVLIERALALIIQNEIKDPRLSKWVTISDIDVSKDIRSAKVYFTVLNDEAKAVSAALKSASPFIRRSLAKSLKLRVVPKLEFVHDDSVAYGTRLSRLIDDVNPDDK